LNRESSELNKRRLTNQTYFASALPDDPCPFDRSRPRRSSVDRQVGLERKKKRVWKEKNKWVWNEKKIPLGNPKLPFIAVEKKDALLRPK
jgi:hypothetical protein